MNRVILQLTIPLLFTCQMAGARLPLHVGSANAVLLNSLQADGDRDQLIAEAERNSYTVRVVFFSGIKHTRDHVLRRRLLFNEGDVFTKGLLEHSMARLNKIRTLEPIRMKDVEVRLDRANKEIDLQFNFKERRKQP
ncbi:MAG: outer membrane protein insertion porin family [Acidobacteriota bacterium]|jgi:outer membrane protein assembly factor BamA|nr:outer membrane protein insertion porin family [Acidobacteriota bacterium]